MISASLRNAIAAPCLSPAWEQSSPRRRKVLLRWIEADQALQHHDAILRAAVSGQVFQGALVGFKRQFTIGILKNLSETKPLGSVVGVA